jgi:exonuclease SbcD
MSFSLGHIGDIHLGSYQGKTEAGGINGRYLDFVKTFNQSIDIMVDRGVDFCLMPGDIFRVKTPSPDELNEFAKGVLKLRRANIPVVITLGNHDLFLSDKRTHAFGTIETLLEDDDKFIISRKPEIIKIQTKNSGIVQVQSMPFPVRSLLRLETSKQVEQYVIDKVSEIYETRDKTLPIVFAGHFSLRDSVVGDEQRYVDKFAEPLISGEIFKGRDYLYCAIAHIHTYQVVYTKPLTVYCGSNNRVDFNEAKEDKGFVIANIDGKSVTHEFIKVDARKFMSLKYDLEKDDDPQATIMEDLKSKKEQLRDSIVRLEITLSEDNQRKWNWKEASTFLDSIVYWIHGIQCNVKKPNLVRNNAGFTESMDAFQALRHYAKVNKIKNQELFLKFGDKIIRESKGGSKDEV